MDWNAKRMEIAAKIKTLLDAGFSRREIIDIKKADMIDELVKGKEVLQDG